MAVSDKLRWGGKPYHTLDYELKARFGEKVYKIALDAGMTCPNRDGSCGNRGCIFCSEGGSGDFAGRGDSVKNQLADGLTHFRDKKTGNLFIAYFQSFTNTYAPADRLEKLYRDALDEPQITGISIATRPDCLDTDIIMLLDRLNREYSKNGKFIWVELGLQTIHEETAGFIRRGYTLSVFEGAVKALNKINIPVIAHVILGLPGEDKIKMLKTCSYLSNKTFGVISGIKLQLLHVLKNTDLAALYDNKYFEALSLEEYTDIVISCLEVLRPDIVVHRVTGDGPKNLLIAPLWSLDKRNVLNTLHKEMKRRGTYQSAKYREYE